jgi:hypothetical protein
MSLQCICIVERVKLPECEYIGHELHCESKSSFHYCRCTAVPSIDRGYQTASLRVLSQDG